ncbi:pyridoxal phosphate-dependent transferase [Collybia nuda]|uniref:Pyridoxal phosphate-dependent transferase n=1 Tax=Collybia nuda TaxID=64659 RepID=A0A9P5Y3N4_9AGAR|nr:pyridoxal phosphate-dependent transferase [Collybia nuda]
MATLDVSKARANFPSLKSGYIFADNAGGSQATKGVVDKISDYLLNTNVQLGADYSTSVQSTTRVLTEGPTVAAKLFNAENPEEIVFSASSTMNLENLSRGLEKDIQEGDEFIITGEHEANVGPWKKLAARRGAIVKLWKATPTNPENPYSVTLKIDELLPLVTSKTRIVAFTACSNILGSIVPVKEVIAALRADAKAKGAKKVEVSVDCVAYAPHRFIDARDWDVDFCVFSFYKVYGPHASVLYVRSSVLQTSVSSIAHHFLDVHEKAYKLQPGGPGYEIVYGTTAVVDYLLSLTPSNDLAKTFEAIAAHEQEILTPLLTYLTDPAQRARGVRVVGDEKPGPTRVPTISFVVIGQNPIKSRDIVDVFDKKGGIGIRYGHFYAYTLVDGLSPKLDVNDGVVRISLVHYNTIEEVQKIISILKEILNK